MLNCLQIIKILESEGLQQDGQYKQEEITNILDLLCQKQFDRDIASQLFEECKSSYMNFKQIYRLTDFAQTIMDACNILDDKIKKADSQLQHYRNLKSNCETSLQTTSPYSDVRFLFVTLVQVLGISNKIRYTSCHILLTLGTINQTSKPQGNYDRINPQFNSEFEFSIPPLISYLMIQLFITPENSNPKLFGQAQLILQQLDDQVIKEISLPLKDPVGREIGTVINLEAQIIVNKHQYLQSQIAKYDQKIFTLENDLMEYQSTIETIQDPFLTKMQEQQKNKTVQPIFNTWQQQQQQQQQQQDNIILNSEQQNNQYRSQDDIRISQNLQKSQREEDILDQTPEAPIQLQQGMIIFTIYGLITLLVCFAKPSFLDFLVSNGLLFTVFLDRFETFHIKVVGGGLVASIFYDILWLKQYHIWWNSNDNNNPEWGLEAINLLRFVLLFTYIQFIYKFIVCYYLYLFYKEAEDPNKRYIFIIWKIVYKVGQSRENISWQ